MLSFTRVCWGISCRSSAHLWFVSALAFVYHYCYYFSLLVFKWNHLKEPTQQHHKRKKAVAASFVRHANATQTKHFGPIVRLELLIKRNHQQWKTQHRKRKLATLLRGRGCGSKMNMQPISFIISSINNQPKQSGK